MSGAATIPDTDLSLVLETRLGGPFAAALRHAGAADQVAAQVAEMVGSVAGVLGIPAEIRAVVDAPEDTSESMSWLRLRVAGIACRFPSGLPAQVLAALDGRLPTQESPPPKSSWPTSDLTVERLAALIATTCAEAVKLQPSVLLQPPQAQACLRRLLEASPQVSPHINDAEWFRQVLADVLNLGISVGNLTAVGSLLQGVNCESIRQAQESLIAGLARDKVDVLVPEDMAPAIGTCNFNDSDDLLARVATQIFEDTGIVPPPFVISAPDGLPTGTFAIRINDLQTLAMPLLAEGQYLVDCTPELLASLAPDAESVLNPLTERPGAIVSRVMAEALGGGYWVTWDRNDFFLLALTTVMRNRLACFVHQDRVLAQLGALEQESAALVRAARAQVSPAELAAALRRLVHNGVSIRHLPVLLDRLVDLPLNVPTPDRFVLLDDPVSAPPAMPQAASEDQMDTFIRAGLRDYIAQNAAQPPGVIVVYLLDPELEELVCSLHRTENDEERILSAVQTELATLPPRAPACSVNVRFCPSRGHGGEGPRRGWYGRVGLRGCAGSRRL